MTRAISHGRKQSLDFYRGPDCKTAERGRRESLASLSREAAASRRCVLSPSFRQIISSPENGSVASNRDPN